MNDSMLALLGLGFVIGFFIALAGYIVSKIAGKKTPVINLGLLIVGILLLLVFLPLNLDSLAKLILSLILCAFILTNVVKSLQSMGIVFYDKQISNKRIQYINFIIYLVAAGLAILLAIIKNESINNFTYTVCRQVIFVGLGLWVSLRILLQQDVQEESNQQTPTKPLT